MQMITRDLIVERFPLVYIVGNEGTWPREEIQTETGLNLRCALLNATCFIPTCYRQQKLSIFPSVFVLQKMQVAFASQMARGTSTRITVRARNSITTSPLPLKSQPPSTSLATLSVWSPSLSPCLYSGNSSK